MRPENEWFKPEKLTALYFVYWTIVAALTIAFAAGVVAVGAFADAPLWLVAGFVAPTIAFFAFWAWWITAFYRTAQYRLTDEEIEYHRGVFFRQKTTVPYDRITNAGASQGPIQRLVGAGSVGIHTAGYGGQAGAELSIGGIADYDDVKEQILDKVRGRRPVATASGEDSAVSGENSAVSGEEATMRGEGATMRGEGATMRGEGATMRGEGATASGNDAPAHGAGPGSTPSAVADGELLAEVRRIRELLERRDSTGE